MRSATDGPPRDYLPVVVAVVVVVLDVLLLAQTGFGSVVSAAVVSTGGLLLVRELRLRRFREDELRRSTEVDPTTGLSREHVLRAAVAEAQRGEHLIIAQCSGLRALVRRLDPDEADRLVRELSSLVVRTVPAATVVARTADDEFAAIVHGDPEEPASGLAALLDDAVTVPAATLSAKIDVRIGLVELGRGEGEPLDQARHAASVSDPGRAVRFGPSLERAYELERDILRDLPRALSEGSLMAHLQPIVELGRNRVVGAEALARWYHPTHGWVRPDLFIRIAEESGAIVELGAQMLRHSLTAAARLRALPDHEQAYVTVNVSPRQLEDDGFADLVAAELAASGLAGSALVLELTEGVAASRDPSVHRAIDEVRRMGVRLAIDDFGAGFASVNYLRRFRPDVVKVDRAYVADLGRRGGDVAAALFQLLDGLDLPVIAEGVEHDETLALLRGLGCRYGQGYHFAKPGPVEALLAYAARASGDTAPVPVARPRRRPGRGRNGEPVASALASTIRPLVRSTVVVPPDRACMDVEQLFNRHFGLNLVVVDRGDGSYSTVSSAALHSLMAGPYGYGRSLHSQRSIGEMVPELVRPLDGNTEIVDAVAVALSRPEAERYDDLVVVADTVGTVSVGRLMEALADDLRSQALRDPLTGLPNRRRFHEALDQQVPRGRATVLYVDLDGFKPVNDLYGHAAGDAVLVSVSTRMRTCARPRDVVARLGGDEFAMLLDGGDETAGRTVADRLVTALQVPIDVDGITVEVGASIGIATGTYPDGDAIIAAADAAMYRAKSDPDVTIAVADPPVVEPAEDEAASAHA